MPLIPHMEVLSALDTSKNSNYYTIIPYRRHVYCIYKKPYCICLSKLIMFLQYLKKKTPVRFISIFSSNCVCTVHVLYIYAREHSTLYINVVPAFVRKRENEYLNNVKETAKTPLSVALCGRLWGMLSSTSYCSYIVYSHRHLAFFSGGACVRT